MGAPMYRRIAGDLKAQIESGAIAPGSQLPTELELRSRYDAARNTVRNAIKLLVGQGLVERRPGLGTFAVRRLRPFTTTLSAVPRPSAIELGLIGGEGENAFAEIREQGRTPWASVPQVKIWPAGVFAAELIAERLNVAPEAQVVSRQQERYIDKMPWSVQASYYPYELVTRGALELLRAESFPSGTTSYLEQSLGLVQVGYRELILVRLPTDEEVKFFELPGTQLISVVTIARTSYSGSDGGPVPFRVTVSVLPADRNLLTISSGAVPVSTQVQDGQDIGPVQEIQLQPSSQIDRIYPTHQAIPLSRAIPTTGMTR
jgi:GntR family transcriptional regulator